MRIGIAFGLLFLIISETIYAQEVERSIIATAGSTLSIEELSIEWTLGEAFISGYEGSTARLDEGFHQGDLVFTNKIELPDLSISDFELESNSLIPGERFIQSQLHYTIEDNSLFAHGNLVYIDIVLSRDTLIDESDLSIAHIPFQMDGMYVEDSIIRYIDIPDEVGLGEWYFLIQIDSEQSIDESDESNNVFYYTIHIVDPSEIFPDLIVENVGLIEEALYPGGQLKILNFTMKNIGVDASLAVGSSLFLSYNDSYGDTDDIEIGFGYFTGTLDTDDSVLINVYFETPDSIAPGRYTAFLCINPYGIQEESNYENNCYSFDLFISDPFNTADLIVDFIDSHSFYYQNDYALIDITIANQGGTDGSDFIGELFISVDTVWSEDDVELGLIIGDTVKSNESVIHTTYAFFDESAISAGDYYLIIRLDIYDQIFEYDESNNTRYKSVTILDVEEAPDLIVEDVEVSSSINANDSLALVGTIQNIGAGIARESRMTFYYSLQDTLSSASTYLGYTDIGELDASAIEEASFTFYLGDTLLYATDSSHYVHAVADGFGRLGEPDETNNVKGIKLDFSNQMTTSLSNMITSDLFTLYPIPAMTTIHVQKEDPRFSDYEILDILGRIAKSGKFTEVIDISDLHPGHYWMRINDSGGGYGIRSFVKE